MFLLHTMLQIKFVGCSSINLMSVSKKCIIFIFGRLCFCMIRFSEIFWYMVHILAAKFLNFTLVNLFFIEIPRKFLSSRYVLFPVLTAESFPGLESVLLCLSK